MDMTVNFDRRGFLKSSAAATGGLMLPSFVVEAAELTAAGKVPSYASWKDVYRSQWTWDKVVRSTHHLNCWYQAHCSWDIYVKDGLVYREEQAAEYPQVNSSSCRTSTRAAARRVAASPSACTIRRGSPIRCAVSASAAPASGSA
jgi:anaerobic selenocysteine-containing dehydrogenase